MKKWTALWLAVCLMLTICGCGPGRQQQERELVVFAAASMTETLTILGERYMQAHPGVRILFNFDSSGTLKTQIAEGAVCDLFISAGQRQMDQLDPAADPRGLDIVLAGSRRDILENKVVLAVPQGNPRGIGSYEDLARLLEEGSVLLAMGNGDVPAGEYAGRILTYYGLEEGALAAAGCITYGSNVKEITVQLTEGVVDCGILYSTDAFSAGLTVVDTATREMCGRVVYPAAVLKTGEQTQEAQRFLDYLLSGEAAEVFESVGFTPLSGT